VQTASRYEQKTTEAPSSVNIVTSDQIKKYGYRTLADILRGLPGFYVSYDRNYHYLGVRGFSRPTDYNTRLLLLIDGHRINDNIYDTATIGTEFVLDIDLIDKVEIVRGPSSSIYGSNAFFGVINVLTKKGRSLRGLESSGEVGGLGTLKGRLTYGDQFQNGMELLLSGTAYRSKGEKSLFYPEYADPATNNGYAEKMDGDRSYSLFSTLSFGDLTLQGGYVTREKDIPTGSYWVDFNDPRNQTRDDRGYLNLMYQSTVAESFDIQAKLFYDYYHYYGDYAYSSVINKDFSWGKWAGGELNVVNTSLERHKIIGGAEFRKNFRQDQLNYDEGAYPPNLDDQRDSDIWALYLQDEFRILNNVILNAGLRYDHYSTFGDTLNPRAGLIYSPFEKTSIKLLYGQAFRPPNAFEAYYSDGGNTSKANPDLRPEKIRTYELVCEHRLGDHLRGSASFYYYKIKNLIDQTTDPLDDLSFFQNLGSAEAKGVELALEGNWKNGLEGRISYAYQRAKNSETGLELTNSPHHLAKLNLIAPLYEDKTFAGIELQYTGKRKTLGGKEADDYLLANLTLFRSELIKGLEISGSIYNLFNKKYSDPGGVEHLQDLLSQDGRSFRLKLTYRF
jgi:iron complex outermembrane receptor protein